MVKLAITGCIGSGKSVVARAFEIMGVPVYDCDSRAKRLMVTNPCIVKGLKRMFGEECYAADGELNRAYLASRLFIDSDKVKRVNALVHPVVKNDFLEWASQQNVPVVAVETALLYESGVIDVVDKALVVWADEETAIRRTMLRSGMSRNQVLDRMHKQMSADDLLLLSDFSIFNNGNEPVLPQVVALLDELRSNEE